MLAEKHSRDINLFLFNVSFSGDGSMCRVLRRVMLRHDSFIFTASS